MCRIAGLYFVNTESHWNRTGLEELLEQCRLFILSIVEFCLSLSLFLLLSHAHVVM